MDNEKTPKDGRREKRRIRFSHRGSSIVSTQSNSDSTASTSIISAISRLSQRESRKLRRKGASISTHDIESETRESTLQEESFIAEESETNAYDLEEDPPDNLSESYYSIPGAFRVKRKCVNSRQIEFALDEGSIESFSTAKTPPVVIPSASLVQDNGEGVVDDHLPLAFPESNGVFVTRRHVCICVVLSFLAFVGLSTGLLFALWDRQMESGTRNIAVASTPVTTPTLKPSLNEGESVHSPFAPSTAPNQVTTLGQPTISPTYYMSGSENAGQPTSHPTRTTSVPTTGYPTTTPSQSPTRTTSVPTTGYPTTTAPTRAPNGGFSLTSRPTSSTNSQTINPFQ